MLFVSHYSAHMMVLTRSLDELINFSSLDVNGTHDTVSIDRLKPAYFECLAPTPSSPPTTTPVDPLPSTPPTPIRTSRSGRHVGFLKDLTCNNLTYFMFLSIHFLFHTLFHTSYVHSYIHSLFNHSFPFIPLFCFLLFCLFRSPPLWGGSTVVCHVL